MHLSKLQLLGFKSFPEKTELKFGRGITCIVGPNGCGKTNLLDAIRWVLGETRMSVLRGSRLEEIIFAGTKDYKPLGMAEVAISFDNHDHTVPSGYDEIDVTRRLFRSGDSEFLLNRTPCRLKDITSMFLDTGLGPGAYSVIEQSMVDVLLSDKAEDRRFLFEEAAGITKYKQRKRAALRKLETTESDLLRLRDVVTEVGSQVSILKRQVSKAERYKELTEEIKRIGISVSSAGWNSLAGKENDLSKILDGLRVKADANAAKQGESELRRERIALERAEHDQQARDVQSQLEKAVGKCHALENEVSVLREKIRNAAESFSQAGVDIDNLERRRDSLERELDQNDAEQGEVTRSIDELNRKLAEVETELEAKNVDCTRLRKLVKDKQAEADDLHDKLAGKRETQLSLHLRYNTESEKMSEVDAEIEKLAETLQTLSSGHAELKSEISQVAELVSSNEAGVSRIESMIRDIQAEIDDQDAQKQRQTAELEKTVARLEFLENVISDYEGYGEGTASIGKLKDEIPGVIDTVANLIDVRQEYCSLIQAVLGEYAGYFVVEDDTSAAAVLERVRSEKSGRVGLIVRSRVDGNRTRSVDEPPKTCRPIRSLVSVPDDLAGLLDFLMDGHYIVDADTAAPVSDYPSAYFWDDRGEVVAWGGSMRSAGSQEVVLVGRKRELESLSARRRDLSKIISALEESRGEKLSDRDKALADLTELRGEAENLKARSTDLSIRNSNIEYELTTLNRRKSEKEYARKELAGSIESISRDEGELSKDLDDHVARESEIEHELTEAQTSLQNAEEDFATIEKQSNRHKMELISVESRLSTLRSNHGKLGELRDDILETVKSRKKQQSELLSLSVESKRLIHEKEEYLKDEFATVERKKSEILRINSEISELDGQIKAIDEELRSSRREGAETLEKIHGVELDLSSLRSRKTNLVDDSIEHYDFDPSTSSLRVKLSDEQLGDLNEELSRLRKRREGLGPVNMLALDEYEEQNKRYQFLSEQVADLTSAKEDLRSTISRINTTAKKLFMETLEAVRANFQQVFRELFEGGEADVTLEEGGDPLEANIIITARPRGKKILSIQQLSGGERALTSISLLFSLYLVKPSPFCILDEVDAPLDDANIVRFLKMIKRFSDTTQFMIITHNKLTMEAADVLYGITMSQPGVSQIVSVNLKTPQEQGAGLDDDLTEELEPEDAVEAK